MPSQDDLAAVLDALYIDDSLDFHELLLNSKVQSGPFDGGCLICAKAILSAIGHGELIRVVSRKNEVEHYGALIDGVIYDMSGSFVNEESWLSSLKAHFHLDRDVWVESGYVQSEIHEDTDCESDLANKICSLLTAREKVAKRKY